MSDAIQYCKKCPTQVMCHMERKCMKKALGLSSAAGSKPKTQQKRRCACCGKFLSVDYLWNSCCGNSQDY